MDTHTASLESKLSGDPQASTLLHRPIAQKLLVDYKPSSSAFQNVLSVNQGNLDGAQIPLPEICLSESGYKRVRMQQGGELFIPTLSPEQQKAYEKTPISNKEQKSTESLQIQAKIKNRMLEDILTKYKTKVEMSKLIKHQASKAETASTAATPASLAFQRAISDQKNLITQGNLLNSAILQKDTLNSQQGLSIEAKVNILQQMSRINGSRFNDEIRKQIFTQTNKIKNGEQQLIQNKANFHSTSSKPTQIALFDSLFCKKGESGLNSTSSLTSSLQIIKQMKQSQDVQQRSQAMKNLINLVLKQSGKSDIASSEEAYNRKYSDENGPSETYHSIDINKVQTMQINDQINIIQGGQKGSQYNMITNSLAVSKSDEHFAPSTVLKKREEKRKIKADIQMEKSEKIIHEDDTITEEDPDESSQKLESESEEHSADVKDEDFLVKKPTSKAKKNSPKLTGSKSSKNAPPQFVCNQCNEHFKSAQSLGGHISRKHPKSSEQYQIKMKRREERTFDRKLLELAKSEHMKQFGDTAELNRVKIRRFKKELRAKFEAGKLKIQGFTPSRK